MCANLTAIYCSAWRVEADSAPHLRVCCGDAASGAVTVDVPSVFLSLDFLFVASELQWACVLCLLITNVKQLCVWRLHRSRDPSQEYFKAAVKVVGGGKKLNFFRTNSDAGMN